MAESNSIHELLLEKQRHNPGQKIPSTFRCSSETWDKLRTIQDIYKLKMNDTLEAIIEFAYQNL